VFFFFFSGVFLFLTLGVATIEHECMEDHEGWSS